MNDSSTSRDREAAATEYAQCMERELAARQALQVQTPGSAHRAHAWAAWLDAVSSTNRSLRRLNSERASQRGAPGEERPHAGA